MAAGAALCVFAREPVPGRAKTRLAPLLGAESSALLARSFLLDTLDRLRPFPGDLWLAHTPADAGEAFRQLLEECEAPPFLMPQATGDLGSRLDLAICRLRERGYERVLLLGADSPTLPWPTLMTLHEGLAEYDFTLGPARDGGFWGLGARIWRAGLLYELPWSAPETFAATRDRLLSAGSVALAPSWYDVDTSADLIRLSVDPALPYCPRTNRLVHSERVAPFLDLPPQPPSPRGKGG
jgi:rSAM/selenodomain-associated transferase 1